MTLKKGTVVIYKTLTKINNLGDYDLEDLNRDYEYGSREIVTYLEDRDSYVVIDSEYDELEEVPASELSKYWTEFDEELYLEQAAKIQALIDADELNSFRVNSLHQKIKFKKDSMEVGCQNITKEDAIKIAVKILNEYAE